jgi:hypothetical protein
VPALEPEIDVGGIEKRSIDALHRLTTRQRRRHAGSGRAAQKQVEVAGLKAVDAILERCQSSNLEHRAHRAATQQT